MNAVRRRALTTLALLVPVSPAFAHDSAVVHGHAMGAGGMILLAVLAGLFVLAVARLRVQAQSLARQPVRAVRERRHDPR